MIVLRVLTGKQAGSSVTVRRFPFRVGRAAGNHLGVEDEGVWPRHLTLEVEHTSVLVQGSEHAVTLVNGVPVERAVLRNGDVLTAGAWSARFSFGEVEQKRLKMYDRLLLVFLLAVMGIEVYLILTFMH